MANNNVFLPMGNLQATLAAVGADGEITIAEMDADLNSIRNHPNRDFFIDPQDRVVFDLLRTLRNKRAAQEGIAPYAPLPLPANAQPVQAPSADLLQEAIDGIPRLRDEFVGHQGFQDLLNHIQASYAASPDDPQTQDNFVRSIEYLNFYIEPNNNNFPALPNLVPDLPIVPNPGTIQEALARFQELRELFPNNQIIQDQINEVEAIYNEAPNDPLTQHLLVNALQHLNTVLVLLHLQVPDANRYSAIQNVGYRNVPTGTENVLNYSNIESNTPMVNFLVENDPERWESNLGRYYTRESFNRLALMPNGLKLNPFTRLPIQPEKVRAYTARLPSTANISRINTTLFTEGGKRKKTRKSKKSKKTKKTYKH